MINIYCYDVDVVLILFPELQPVVEGTYVGHKQIFIGRGHPVGEDDAYCLFRVLNAQVQLSLPDRWAVVEYAFKRKGRKVTKSLQKHVERLEKDEFITEFRVFMAMGKWSKVTKIDAKIYNLFKDLTESREQFMTSYFLLREKYSYQEIWASILTFFSRVLHYDSTDASLSDFYKKVIERFKNQSGKIKAALTYFLSNEFTEMNVIVFLLSVR